MPPIEHYEAGGIGAWAIHVDGQPVAVVYGDPDTVPALAATRTGQDFLQPERPGRPIIQHGNADIALSMCDLVAPTPAAEHELFPERDDLDPELRLAAHAYGAALLSIPHPVAPEYEDPSPGDWDEAYDRAVANGGPF